MVFVVWWFLQNVFMLWFSNSIENYKTIIGKVLEAKFCFILQTILGVRFENKTAAILLGNQDIAIL